MKHMKTGNQIPRFSTVVMAVLAIQATSAHAQTVTTYSGPHSNGKSDTWNVPGAALQWNKAYAVTIHPDAINSTTGISFAGITDNTTWNFATAPGDPLIIALEELIGHIVGNTLTGPEIAAHKAVLDAEKSRLDETATAISTAFNLVTTYDTLVGPLWVLGSPVQSFDRRNTSDEDINWVVFNVMQYIMDEVYNAATLADPAKRALLDGFKFGSSADFPGAVDPPAPPTTRTATISASFPETFGRDTQGWTESARKPTGCYLAPGSIVTVQVPPELVGRGIRVRVGAHSWDHEAKNRRPVPRLSRATILYGVDATEFEIGSPYGGGIYFEIPKGLELGVVEVNITGAARSPYFSVKPFDTTTDADWISSVVNADPASLAPWADFQTGKFMMQVPTSWVNKVTDPTARMAKWDAAMDAINDLMGFPRIRGKETMYIQVDLILRSSVHAPGYPAVNVTYNPDGNYNGDVSNYFVRGPQSGATTEFHEQGHAYFFPKFGGESESNVNLLYAAARNLSLGASLDDAFRTSVSYGNFGNVTNAPLDNTAVLWMTSFNFAPYEEPMASWEKAYQPQGHAKFVDIARLFGWDKLGAFWYYYNEGAELGENRPTDNDSMMLQLCKSVGKDVRPLLHFWGIQPQNPASLNAAISSAGLSAPAEIYDTLLHYKTLIPADNPAYQSWCLYWYGKQPSINGNGCERVHARQWDTTDYWNPKGYRYSGTDPNQADGEKYTGANADRIRVVIDGLVALYYPNGRPDTDYTNWSGGYPAAELIDTNADLDGDGMTNNEERLFGLDPTSSASVNPITVPLNASGGTFSYTRRDSALTGAAYSVWTSTNLADWSEDTSAIQAPDLPIDGVETVVVTLSPALRSEPRIFVQVRATE